MSLEGIEEFEELGARERAGAELALRVKRAAFGVVLSTGGAALIGLSALLCAVGATVAVIAGVVSVRAWAAALIVAGGLLCVAGVAGFAGVAGVAGVTGVTGVKAEVNDGEEHLGRPFHDL